MRPGTSLQAKVLDSATLSKQLACWRLLGKTIAFTNGCFDIIHAGHIASLTEAARHADILIVGLNSDASVRGLKGEGRPVNDEGSRAQVLASLYFVDAVVIFKEETPLELINIIRPQFLIKGGDYKAEDIAGAKEVAEWGGHVIINPLVEGFSTTGTLQKIKNL